MIKKILFILLLGVSSFIYGQGTQEFPVFKGEYIGQKLPGITPEVFAPGIVSDTSWEGHCQIAVSPDGDEIYWSAWTMKYPAEDGETNTEQLFYSKLVDGVWTKPALTEFVKDFLTSNNGCPVFSSDGNKLFFSSNRPGGLGEKDTWYVERTNKGWSNPVNVGEPYNSIGNNDWTPVFTKKGNAFHMGWDENEKPLCFKYSNDIFSEPVHVIIHPDFHPWWSIYVSPDESYLIFAGYHYLQNFGNLDLYICFKIKDGQWGYPINMGNKINTERTERFPVVSPDGKYMFFVRHTETQDFFWVSTAIFDDLKRDCIEKTKNPPPAFKAVDLKSEDLDKYPGVYSGSPFTGKLIITKEGNILKYQGYYHGNVSPVYSLECYETDRFKNDRNMVNFEFSPNDNKLKIFAGRKYELTKE
jgi:hypothetical protein